jgi:PAS domain S-box-containing protein
VEDDRGDFWITSPLGIFRTSRKQLNDFCDGRITSIQCDSFNRADGMVRSECSGAAQPSAWKDHKGNLWFAVSKGLVVTSPDKIKLNAIAPPVHVEEVYYDHKPIQLTSQTKLPTGKDTLEFHYAAMSFSALTKVRYKFRLEGFETDWVDADTRRVAYYSNLRPGDYTFHVIACNNDGLWNEAGDRVSFSCVPPWYQNNWFYASCSIAVVFGAVGFYALRVRSLKNREAQLLKHSQELQQEISERQQAQTKTAAFSNLGQKLNAAANASEAASIIVRVADELLRWDACSVLMYSEEKNEAKFILRMDTIRGERISVAFDRPRAEPTPMLLKVMKEGSQLILRDSAELAAQTDLVPFGDKTRRSASLLFVPVRVGEKTIGMLTIQSYTPQAYNLESLRTLEALASHCGGALERITVQDGLREAHDKLEARVEERTAELSKANQQLTQQIAERQKAESALVKSESQLRLIWETSLDGMRLLDEQGNFILVNDAYCKLVGKSKDALIGHSIATIYEPSRTEEILSKHRERFRTQTFPHLAEKEEVLWNGRKIHLEVSNSFLHFDGAVTAVLTTVRDITDRKRLEEQARQSQKMESIGQLAAGIAHDFNNLLTVIQGHTSLLSAEETDLENAQSLKEIGEAAERAANLTKQLLAFSRRQIMQAQTIDLNEVVAQVAKMLRRVLGEHIDLQLHYTPHLPAIHADTGMIVQIIINIAVNARDAMPKGGRLTIDTEAVQISEVDLVRNAEARLGSTVCLRITDTGCGMDQATLQKIFEPFFTTKEVGQGTGLGLSTVYGIVKQHRGWIEVESQPGKGSTFQIFFPALSVKAQKAPEPPKPKATGGKEMLLVVEDEEPLRLLTQRVLHHYGYRVLVARSGVEALKLWQRQKTEIDLLLTDMMMPEGISGHDLAERLLAERPGLKVIYSSGYSAELLGDNALGEESYFLPKPYTPVELAQIVRDCLDNRQRAKVVPA